MNATRAMFAMFAMCIMFAVVMAISATADDAKDVSAAKAAVNELKQGMAKAHEAHTFGVDDVFATGVEPIICFTYSIDGNNGKVAHAALYRGKVLTIDPKGSACTAARTSMPAEWRNVTHSYLNP